MEKVIDFNSNQTIKVTDEKIGGILLDFVALKADDTVADIADLNKVAIELSVTRRGNGQKKTIFNGYLDDYLSAIYAGTTGYDIATTKRSTGYLMGIPFNGALHLRTGDTLKIQIKAQTTSFTSLSTTKSEISVETVPSTSTSPVISIVDSVVYTPGEVTATKNLGSGLIKVVLANDFTSNYNASSKAKPTNGISLVANGYKSDASENLLILENLHYLGNNPATEIKHLILYKSKKPLNRAKLSLKYDKAVDADAKIMCVRQAVL